MKYSVDCANILPRPFQTNTSWLLCELSMLVCGLQRDEELWPEQNTINWEHVFFTGTILVELGLYWLNAFTGPQVRYIISTLAII